MYLIKYNYYLYAYVSPVDFMHDISFLCDYLRLDISVGLFVIYLSTYIYLFLSRNACVCTH